MKKKNGAFSCAISIAAILSISFSLKSSAQAPNINYASPQVFTVNSPAPTIVPSNSGGAVPAFAYGQVTTFSGIAAGLSSPSFLASDAQGNIYLTVSGSNTLRKISTTGTVTTF